jgi:N-carbamoylputrescine amidase
MQAAPLRIGVAQIDTRLATAEANLDKHLEYIERARAEGVEFLVFPETSLTGFPHREGDGGVHRHALSRRSAPIQRVLEAAGDMVVVVGCVSPRLVDTGNWV